jgi:hypothetical protein
MYTYMYIYACKYIHYALINRRAVLENIFRREYTYSYKKQHMSLYMARH